MKPLQARHPPSPPQLRRQARLARGNRRERGEPLPPIKAAIDRAMADLARQIQADADRQHAAVNTPAAYETVQRRCSGW